MSLRLSQPAIVVVAAAAAFCASERTDRDSPSPTEAPSTGTRPLETESIETEEIRVPEAPPAAPAPRGPCSWARAWDDPGVPNPVPPGGSLELKRIATPEIRLPHREPAPPGEARVELVVGTDGTVTEAKVVRGFEPPWPEAEEAVLSAVRRWRYEPPRLDGTPVSVCSSFLVRP